MGFRIRKSISLGKGLRLNLGKSGVTSVTMGKRGAPHVTVGKGGTRFGTPIIPGTGISYETRLDKPSKKARRKNTTMGSQKEPAYTPSTFPTPTQQLPTTSEQPMEILAPTEVLQQPPATPTTPPRDGGNGGRNGRHGSHGAKKPWYKRWWGITIIVLLTIGVIGYIFTPSKAIPDVVGQTVFEAKIALEKEGFKTITVTPDTKGKDRKWKVEEQTPEAGQKEKTSTSITLTVKRDTSDLPNIAKKGMMLDKAITALTDEGYDASDYKIGHSLFELGDSVSEQRRDSSTQQGRRRRGVQKGGGRKEESGGRSSSESRGREESRRGTGSATGGTTSTAAGRCRGSRTAGSTAGRAATSTAANSSSVHRNGARRLVLQQRGFNRHIIGR